MFYYTSLNYSLRHGGLLSFYLGKRYMILLVKDLGLNGKRIENYLFEPNVVPELTSIKH